MSVTTLFSSEIDLKKFKDQLINYFHLKQDGDVSELLSKAKIGCEFYSHDNWNGGFDEYELTLAVPVDLYVKLENELNDIAGKITIAANHTLPGVDKIGFTTIHMQEVDNEVVNQNLLALTEKIKTTLIAKATGQNPDQKEFEQNRKLLLSATNLKTLIPLFLKNYGALSEFEVFIKSKYSGNGCYKLRREYIVKEFQPLIHFLTKRNYPVHATTEEALTKLNVTSVQETWEKAIIRSKSDPAGAITAARTLLEDTIKHILNNLNIEYDDGEDLPKIYGLLAKQLNLAPSQHYEEIFKQILGGCHSVVQGLGTLRNKMGDAHASGKKPVKPAPRHAELAVNLAGSMASFLISTWENKSYKK